MKIGIKIIFLFFSLSLLQAVDIVLTFDDFPMSSTPLFEKEERVKIYAEKLAAKKITAAFFCIGAQISDETVALLGSSHILANHSFTHPYLSAIPLEDFKEELLKTESLLISLPNYRKWFRYPYLDFGDRSEKGGSEKKKKEALRILREKEYRHAYVSINTFDWHVNKRMLELVSRGEDIDWDALGKVYLSLLDKWMEDAVESFTKKIKGRWVHVLLLHQNDLNALFLEDIIELIEKKNWKIVLPEMAFESNLAYPSLRVAKRRGLPKVPTLNTEYVDAKLKEKQLL